MIFLSSTRTSSLAILYLLVTRSIISSEFVRLFFDSFTDFFLRNHGVLIFNRSTKPSAMASTAPRISKIPPSPKPRYPPNPSSIFHSIFFRFNKLRSIFKSESPILNDLVEKWGHNWTESDAENHERASQSRRILFLLLSSKLDFDGSGWKGRKSKRWNCSRGSRKQPSLPTIESADALWPPLLDTENYTPRIISPGEADI